MVAGEGSRGKGNVKDTLEIAHNNRMCGLGRVKTATEGFRASIEHMTVACNAVN